MEVLERHSGNNASGNLFDCEDISITINFSKMFFGSGDVHNKNFHQLIYSIVGIHFHDDRFYYQDNSGINFITHLKDLLNCLFIRVGMCSTDTRVITHDMVIKNGETFKNIKSATRVANFCDFKE